VKGWTVVFRGPDYAAAVVAAALEAAGLRVETMTDTGHLWPGVMGQDSRVFVPEEQVQEAQHVLRSDFADQG